VAEVEARAARYGLPPVAWPPDWPPNTLGAMRAATWAGDPAFALACFRRAYRDGEDLASLDVLAAAAGDAGLDPSALRDAVGDPGVKQRLKEETAAAWAAGVTGVPTLRVAGRAFYGDDRLDEALSSASAS
jgi:2-hydroxychromene-2-carboxylate isomerase